METLAADMICGSLPALAAFVPKFLACWERVSLPRLSRKVL